MRKFVITTDSNSDLPSDYIREHNITIIPQYYGFGDEVYGDEKHLTPADFYQKMRDGEMPTSMANNPSVIQSKFEALLSDGYDILHIAFSSQLSGSYGNVVMVANELKEEHPDATIEVIDSCTASLGETLLIMYAYDLKAEDKSLLEIKELIEEAKGKIHADFAVDNLSHLQKGGRISKTTAIVGGIVKIKPVLTLDREGKIIAAGSARGRKKAYALLIERIAEQNGEAYGTRPIGIMHGDCLDDANTFASLIRDKLGCTNIVINDISPSIGTHAGPGVIGVCYWASK